LALLVNEYDLREIELNAHENCKFITKKKKKAIGNKEEEKKVLNYLIED